MKKAFIYSFILLTGLVLGCKKDHKTNHTYLLSQQITDQRGDGLPIDTANYTYDEHDRISTITDGTLPSQVKYTIAYDNQNRVTTARKFDGSGNLIIQFDFFYRGDTTGYYFHAPTSSGPADTAFLIFDTKHQVTQIATKHSGSTVFEYDTKGNVSYTQNYSSGGATSVDNQTSFSYDSQHSPFAQTMRNNYFFMYVVRIGNPSTLINNVVVRNADTYSYTYNKDGFPTQGIISTVKSNIYLYFNYIIK